MRGTIRAKKGRPGYWELRVDGEPDPVTRKRRQKSRGFRGTKKAAEAALRALAAEVDEGRHRSTDATVAQLLERWWDHASPGWAPKTRQRNRGIIDTLGPLIGNVPLSKLRPSELDHLYDQLLGQGLKPNTVRKYHAVMRRALGQAVKWEWIASNPADRDRASPPKVEQHAVQPPSVEQVQALIADIRASRAPEFATFIWLAVATGARRGELCGLRRRDFDPEAGTLRVVRSITQVGQVLEVKSTKTHDDRSIGLAGDEVAGLVDHLAAMETRAATAGTALVGDAYLFSNSLNCSEPWRPDSISNRWRKLCARRGMKGLRLHDLRHFSATELLAGGVPVRTVSARLGHRHTSTTLNIYAAFVPASDRDAARIIGDRLRPPKVEAIPQRDESRPA